MFYKPKDNRWGKDSRYRLNDKVRFQNKQESAKIMNTVGGWFEQVRSILNCWDRRGRTER